MLIIKFWVQFIFSELQRFKKCQLIDHTYLDEIFEIKILSASEIVVFLKILFPLQLFWVEERDRDTERGKCWVFQIGREPAQKIV